MFRSRLNSRYLPVTLFLLSLTLLGCPQPPAPPTPAHTLRAHAIGEGSVAISPAQSAYATGEQVGLRAMPRSGWRFDRWEGGLSGSENPAQLEMRGDARVYAVFLRDGQDGLEAVHITQMAALGRQRGWTFDVGLSEATAHPLGVLTGLLEPGAGAKDGALEGVAGAGKEALPQRFDWRARGMTPPVRWQGACASSWAFATLAQVESAYMLQEGRALDLSEQWLVSCNVDGWGCDGGWWAFDYLIDYEDACGAVGAPLEAQYPYLARETGCECAPRERYGIEAWAYVANRSSVPSVQQIKRALLEHGPVGAGVHAGAAFHAYSGGVFNEDLPGPINHGIVIVGWDDTLGRNGAWLIRNSWGETWGAEGHMAIEYGCSSVGYAAAHVITDVGAVVPEVIAFAPNGGATTTATRTVTLDNLATGRPTHYMASESPTFAGAVWHEYDAAPGFLLSAGDGPKTVYFKVKAAAGESQAVSGVIVLSQPPGPPPSVTVPGVTGLALADAEEALSAAGLSAGSVTEVYSASVAAGLVVSQSPSAGSSAAAGSAVALAVSAGPEPLPVVIVPDVTGLTRADAEATLAATDLSAGAVTEVYSATVLAGLVVSQSPSAGASVTMGAAVALAVSAGPEPPTSVTVPDVVGLTQAGAETALSAAGLVRGAVTEVYSDNVAAGLVVSQSPPAGTTVAPGGAIALAVSAGPQPPTSVAVPDMAGLTQSEAEGALAAAGLGLGAVSLEYSDTVQPGRVISQLPAAGTTVAVGAQVALVVSSGPEGESLLRIVLNRGGKPWIMNTDGTGLELLADVALCCPAPRIRDGRVAFIANGPQGVGLYLMAAEPGAPVQKLAGDLFGTATAAPWGALAFSPDGTQLVFSGARADDPQRMLRVYRVSVDGVGLAEVRHDSQWQHVDFSWNVADRILAHRTRVGNPYNQRLAALSTDGRTLAAFGPEALTGTPWDAGHGGVVSAVSDHQGRERLVLLDATGENLRVVPGARPFRGHAWHPTLNLLFAANTLLGDVYRIDAATGAQQRITTIGTIRTDALDCGSAVVASLPDPIAVPALLGQTVPVAEAAVVAAGLTPGVVSEQYHPTAPVGAVIGQEPAAAAQVFPGTVVSLTVSKGPEPVPVPALSGMTISAAQTALEAVGLVRGTLTMQYHPTVPVDRVISQNPVAGTAVLPGTEVSMAISRGPEPVPVPNVVGMTQSAAQSALASVGLIVGTVTEQYHATVPAGRVLSQNPVAGVTVLPGATVALHVSKGPEPVVVPDVTGMTQSAAQSAIVAAALSVGSVTEQHHATVPAGRVLSQNPAAGASVAPGTAVALVLSKGPDLGDMIPIATVEQLQRIGNDPDYPLDGYYVLTQDIDASATGGWNAGAGFVPLAASGAFTGVFDGQGYLIRGLHINAPSSGSVALFEQVGPQGLLKRFGLVEANIHGGNYTAGLVVHLQGSIAECFVEGTIVGNGIAAGLGLFIDNGSSVTDCYTRCRILGRDDTGGICWTNIARITSSYSASVVRSERYAAGGFCGNMGSMLEDACFWDLTRVRSDYLVNVDSAVGLSTAEMMTEATFAEAGWDFDEVWVLAEGLSYPYLRCNAPLDVPDARGVPLAQAEALLTGAGLRAGALSYRYSDTVPSGSVVEQDPPAGGKALRGDAVALVISKGAATPIAISSIVELQRIGNNPGYPLDGHYYLTQDLDASATAAWNAGAGFEPIGEYLEETYVPLPVFDRAFTGVLDGRGYAIRDLVINRPDQSYVGVFAVIGRGGSVLDLDFDGGSVQGYDYVGALAGAIEEGTAAGCRTSCVVSGIGEVGGLAGRSADGAVIDCHGDGEVSSPETWGPLQPAGTTTGGLIGRSRYGVVADCSHDGVVSGRSMIGGVVGLLQGGVVERSRSGASVSGETSVGGLIGYHLGGTVRYCSSDADVTGARSAGGLVGILYRGEVTRCYAAGSVRGEELAGGLVASSREWGVITDCYTSTALIDASTSTSDRCLLGGIVAESYGSVVRRCYATGRFTRGRYAGGVIGWDFGPGGTVEACFWDVDATGADPTYFAQATGLSTPEMMQRATFENAGWDFVETWGIVEDDTYPYLLHFHGPGEMFISINSVDELQRIGNDPDYPLDGSYALARNIDASATVAWNAGAGFAPLGGEEPFTGVFDGRGFEITGLVVNRFDGGEAGFGLFGVIEREATVKNLGLVAASVTGGSNVGALAGVNQGRVYRCYARDVAISGSYAGGLIGFNEGTVARCYSTGTVGYSVYIGGLAGINSGGAVFQSYSTCAVSGMGIVGGLVGSTEGHIEESYAAGPVSGWIDDGGLVGETSYGVTGCFWDVSASGQASSAGYYETGLTTEQMMQQASFTDAGWDFTHTWGIDEGETYPYLKVLDEPETGPIPIGSVIELQRIGNQPDYPLFGEYYLTQDIDASETAGWNSGAGFRPIGWHAVERYDRAPFAGRLEGCGYTISHLTINQERGGSVGMIAALRGSGAVRDLVLEHAQVSGGHLVGALVGISKGLVAHCDVEAIVSADYDVGGLVGYNSGIIRDSRISGSVLGTIGTGGLAGQHYGEILRCHSSNVVYGYSEAGGLAGYSAGTLSESSTTATVTGEFMGGGLVGIASSGVIEDCYAAGTVYSVGTLGGLCAAGGAQIARCYASGALLGPATTVDGLVAMLWGLLDIQDSFWDIDATGADTSVFGGTGLPTAQMMQQSTYTAAGWNFAEVWGIEEGSGYPYLLWER